MAAASSSPRRRRARSSNSVINTTGVIEANTVGLRGGTIVLGAATADRKPTGAPTQRVKVSGTLKAAGNRKDTKGGTVIVTGEAIEVAGANIDVSGRVGGGKVLIGGDWGGGNPNKSLINNPSAVLEGFVLPNATTVSVDGTTRIDASARERGDGGKVVLWANDTLSFAGTILALGGTQLGNGGFVETSGKNTLDFNGSVDTRAPNGNAGTLLLDPLSFTIWSGVGTAPTGSAMINTVLVTMLGTQNVVIATDNSVVAGDGDIFVNAPVHWSSNTTLTMSAFRDIRLPDLGLSGPNIKNSAAGHLVMRADSTGTGIGTIVMPASTFTIRVDWTTSTGTVTVYYNDPNYSAPRDFLSLAVNGRIAITLPSQFTQFMLVNSASNLQQIDTDNSSRSRFYALGRDIDMTGFAFVPIGTPSSPFTGKLDGLGRTISNLSVNVVDPKIDSLGLFGVIGASGIVQNLNLANAIVNANPNVTGPGQFMGIIAGQNFGQIINVDVHGAVNAATLPGILAGGAIGQNQFSGFVADVIAAVNVTLGDGSFNNAAGHTAVNHGMIRDSSSSGTVHSGMNSFNAGFVVTNNGTVLNSHTTSPVTAAGGDPNFSTLAAGFTVFNSGDIFMSSAAGPVSATSTNSGPPTQLAGFVVFNSGTIDHSRTTSSVRGDALSTAAGFVVGNAGTIRNSDASGPVAGGIAAGFVNINVGNIERSNASGDTTGAMAAGFVLDNVGTIFDSHALGNVNGITNAAGFVLFNGGAIDTATARGDVTVAPLGAAGGFFTFNTGNIIASSSHGAVLGGDQSLLGGFGMLNLEGTVVESFSTSAVTAGNDSLAAGFVTVNLGGIMRAFSVGPVMAGDRSIAGGFSAINAGIPGFDFGTISRAYATSPVTVGDNSFAASFVTLNAGQIHETYSAGWVRGGPNAMLAGHILQDNLSLPSGFNSNRFFPPDVASSTGTATASYWDTDTTGRTNSVGGTPQTSAQLTSGLPGGFDPAAWSNNPGVSYPYLIGQSLAPPLPGTPVPPLPRVPDPPAPPTPELPKVPDPPAPLPPEPQDPVAGPTNIPPTVAVVHDTQRIGEQPAETTTVLAALTTGPAPSGPAPGRPAATQQPQQQRGANVPDRLPSGMPPLTETRFLNNEVVLQLSGNATPEQVAAVARQLGLTVLSSESVGLLGRTVYRFNTGKLSVREAIRLLEANRIARITASAQPSYVFTLAQNAETPPADAQQGDSAQYIISKLRLPQVHRLSTGKDVTIAVIDSEIDAQHPDFGGRIAGRFDAVGADEKPHPHGTAMAGAIISQGKLTGIAPGAKVLAVRAFGTSAKSAQGTSLQIVKGMDWAISQGAKIINMSFAGPRDPLLAQAIKAARDKGIILIAAAGNAGPKSPPLYPGADPNVIAVSATDLDDNTYVNANRGKHIVVAAPGVDILVPAPDGSYQLTTGTSVATAHVSGVAALLLERNPNLKPEAIEAILRSTAKNIPAKAKANEVGAGLVDPFEALNAPEPKPAAVRR